MFKTATEVEVKKTTVTHKQAPRNARSTAQEQSPRYRWLWSAAAFTLICAVSATALLVHRWLNNDESDARRG